MLEKLQLQDVLRLPHHDSTDAEVGLVADWIGQALGRLRTLPPS